MQMLRRVLVAVFLVVACVCAVAFSASAGTQDFIIREFNATYTLGRDEDNVSTMQVNEKITAEFPDFDQNHGILRAIPNIYDGHSLELDVTGVKNSSGKDYQYEDSNSNNNRVLKIGDPDSFAHGQTDYVLDYNLRGVIKDFGDHQELFWDVNGDQWQQTFESVTATVAMPSELQAQLLPENACYVGGYGSKTTCAAGTFADGKITFTAKTPLYASQTMTIVLAFKPGTFAAYKPSPAAMRQQIIQALGFIVPPLAALIIAVVGWRRSGRDDQGRGVIVPQYLPPKDLSVLQSDFVLREHFATKAISATIIDLAVRHYLKVYEIKKAKILKDQTEYELELIKDPSGLNEHELEVVKILFKDKLTVGSRIELKGLQTTLYEEATKLGKKIETAITQDGYFYRSPTRAQAPYQIFAVVLFIAGFFFLPWSLGVLLAAIILFVASFTMPARTKKGVELREYLLGLKVYMKLAEADRLKALQSPHGDLTEKIDVNDKQQLVKLYERLLPYAMLFGIEKDWAKQFANLYDQQPDWYSGSSAFNAAYFAGAVSSFGSSATTSFSAPTSSSGSGFSGGAGGGGGGGGGGGW